MNRQRERFRQLRRDRQEGVVGTVMDPERDHHALLVLARKGRGWTLRWVWVDGDAARLHGHAVGRRAQFLAAAAPPDPAANVLPDPWGEAVQLARLERRRSAFGRLEAEALDLRAHFQALRALYGPEAPSYQGAMRKARRKVAAEAELARPRMWVDGREIRVRHLRPGVTSAAVHPAHCSDGRRTPRAPRLDELDRTPQE